MEILEKILEEVTQYTKDGIQISIMLLHGNLFQNHTRRKRNAEIRRV